MNMLQPIQATVAAAGGAPSERVTTAPGWTQWGVEVDGHAARGRLHDVYVAHSGNVAGYPAPPGPRW